MRNLPGASASSPNQSSTAQSGEHDIDVAAERRITPLVPTPSEWLRDFGSEPLPRPAATGVEDIFWDAPPRYSITTPLSVPPVALPTPSRARRWGARILFVVLAGGVATVLGAEVMRIIASMT